MDVVLADTRWCLLRPDCSMNSTCSNHGTCRSDGSCACVSNAFYGQHCTPCPGGGSNKCFGNGNCGANGCECYGNYLGPTCEYGVLHHYCMWVAAVDHTAEAPHTVLNTEKLACTNKPNYYGPPSCNTCMNHTTATVLSRSHTQASHRLPAGHDLRGPRLL